MSAQAQLPVFGPQSRLAKKDCGPVPDTIDAGEDAWEKHYRSVKDSMQRGMDKAEKETLRAGGTIRIEAIRRWNLKRYGTRAQRGNLKAVTSV